MSKTKTILKRQKQEGGVIRPVFGPEDFVLVHRPRSNKDPKPFVRPSHHPDGEFRYAGTEVWVDKGVSIK
jgi:hypothetical protein